MIGLDAQPQLHDIVSAPAASWWPLAPGWYALAIGTSVALVVLVWWMVRNIQQRRVRRAALTQLQRLQQQSPSLNAISLLLKQAAQAYYPAAYLHATTTQGWWLFLQSQLSPRQQRQYQQLLATLPHIVYQPLEKQQHHIADYQTFAKVWLQQALPPSKRQLAKAQATASGGRHD